VHAAHVTASIEKYGEGYSADDDSQPLTFEVRLTPAGERIIVDAEVSVDRTAFGMTWGPLRMPSATALLVVHAQFNKKG
jgi:polyisoprenoid-binding protein YceI